MKPIFINLSPGQIVQIDSEHESIEVWCAETKDGIHILTQRYVKDWRYQDARK